MLKLKHGGAARVVGIAVKDRSALFLVGPSADLRALVAGGHRRDGLHHLLRARPPGWLPRRPAEAFKDWVWTPSRPTRCALAAQPRAAGAQPVLDLGPEFPHAVGRGKLDDRLYQAIRNTPAGTTVALRAARAAVASLKLGESGTTDLLTVALASVDTVGHQYGTLSRERVDAVLRTHDELSAFLDELRKRLGARLSIVLTSDHGLTPTQAEEQRLRVQGGTITTDELIRASTARSTKPWERGRTAGSPASKGIGSRCARPFQRARSTSRWRCCAGSLDCSVWFRRPRWTRRSHSSGTPGFRGGAGTSSWW